MTTSTFSIPALQQSLSRLTPALEILQGVNHRHKNQHRLSRWWAPFDMLRRQARKLEHELDVHLAAREKVAQPAPPPPLPPSQQQHGKGRRASRGGGGGTAAAAAVTARAAHVCAHLVPRAFL